MEHQNRGAMIQECKDHQGGILLELAYEFGAILARCCERTQAAADVMQDGNGNDLYEQMSATEDDAWMLHQYVDAAWQEVVELCRAYVHCLPTIVRGDEVTPEYCLSLQLPRNWDSIGAVTIDGSIEDMLISSATQEWWIKRGNADLANVEAVRIASCRSKVKYSLNSRKGYKGRNTSYF